MIRSIKLHGALADKLGREAIQFDADNVRMLFSGLEMVYPNFRSVLSEQHDLAIVLKNGEEFTSIDQDRVQFNFGDQPEIHLAAGTQGSGFEVAAFFALEGFAYWATVIAVNFAIAYAVGAIAQSLVDIPEAKSAEQRAANASHLFNGAETVVGQGYPVPLIYGRYKVGSAEISTELSAERQPLALADYLETNSNKTAYINVLANDATKENIVVDSFVINGTTTNAGTTYTHSDYSVLINSNGDCTVIPVNGHDSTFSVQYKARNTVTNASVVGTLSVQVHSPFSF